MCISCFEDNRICLFNYVRYHTRPVFSHYVNTINVETDTKVFRVIFFTVPFQFATVIYHFPVEEVNSHTSQTIQLYWFTSSSILVKVIEKLKLN